eukprot:16008-Heterococcus_DN1.PRE.2
MSVLFVCDVLSQRQCCHSVQQLGAQAVGVHQQQHKSAQSQSVVMHTYRFINANGRALDVDGSAGHGCMHKAARRASEQCESQLQLQFSWLWGGGRSLQIQSAINRLAELPAPMQLADAPVRFIVVDCYTQMRAVETTAQA